MIKAMACKPKCRCLDGFALELAEFMVMWRWGEHAAKQLLKLDLENATQLMCVAIRDLCCCWQKGSFCECWNYGERKVYF